MDQDDPYVVVVHVSASIVGCLPYQWQALLAIECIAV